MAKIKAGSFQKALEKGHKAEDYLIKLLANFGFEGKRVEGNFSFYDLIFSFGGRPITTEVKFDAYEARSGNIAIEYKNTLTKKNSGISSTTAILWVHILDRSDSFEVWVTSVNNLKDFMISNRPLKDLTHCGDGNSSIKLYRASDILDKIFYRIDDISKEEFINIIQELIST